MSYCPLHYKRYPGGNHGTVVLLHGLTGNIGRWADYIDVLQHDYTVLAIDIIGHGGSDFPPSLNAYSLNEQAPFIAEVLERENIESCTLIAHSYSCDLALDVMNVAPCVVRVVFISPFTPRDTVFFRLKKVLLAALMPVWPSLRYQRSRAHPLPINGHRSMLFLENINAIRGIGIKSYLAHLHACFTSISRPGAMRTAPLLVIRRQNDGLCSPDCRATLQRKFMHVQEEIIPGSGHLYLREHRPEILKVLMRFLRSESSSPAEVGKEADSEEDSG